MYEKVYVVDDDQDVCNVISDLAASVRLSCETFLNPEDFLRTSTEEGPGVLVLDVRMPGISGLEVQEELIGRGASIPIIFLTGFGDVWTAVQAMRNGAFAFLEKPFSSQQLLINIQHAIKHHAQVLEAQKKTGELEVLLHNLTPREQDILIRLGMGKSNKAMAEELQLSVRTVEFHRANLTRKLQADSRESVSQIALQLLLLQPKGQ